MVQGIVTINSKDEFDYTWYPLGYLQQYYAVSLLHSITTTVPETTHPDNTTKVVPVKETYTVGPIYVGIARHR